MLHEHLGRKPTHPAKELPEPPAPDELEVALDQQVGDHIGILSGSGVLDRFLHEPLRATPGRRAAAELACCLGAELELQDLSEQMVVAIPLAAIVQRDEEHVRVREVGKHRKRVLAPQNGVAQLRREAPEHRCTHQEVLDLRRKCRQNLFGQIFPNLAGTAREFPYSLVGVPQIPEPQSGQIDARGPSLRAIDKQLHALGGQVDSLTNDELARLLDCESQLPSADLRYPPARPQTPEADRRVRAGRGNQARIRRQPLDRLRDRAHRSITADGVHVVEHDRHPPAIRDEAIHHLIDRGLNRPAPDREARKRTPSKALPEALNRRRQVRPQPHRVPVGRVERYPNHRLGALHTPRPHQRRLAITHRRVQYRERGLVTEHLEQARPAQHPRMNPGRHQLRLDDPRSWAIHLR